MAAGNTPGSQLLPVLGELVRLLRQLDVPDTLSLVAMAVLRRLDRDGAGRVTDLARAERATQPGMTQLIGRLERAGLVQRVPDPQDGRSVLVELTAAGRDLLARTTTHYADTLDLLLSRLDDADRDAISTALPALARLAHAADHPPAGRV